LTAVVAGLRARRADLPDAVVKESRRQVVELVSCAEKAKQGDCRGAVEWMTAAVRKLLDTPQVVFNGVVAVLKHLENLS
jgi:hypothetical protein